MNADRLRRLEALLLHDAEDTDGLRFDLTLVGILPIDERRPPVDLIHCGTTGCAMGLAAMSDVFKEDGLTYVMSGPNNVLIELDGFKAEYDDAAMSFFGIDRTTAMSLFSPTCYTPGFRYGSDAEHEVARRISVLVEKGEITNDDIQPWLAIKARNERKEAAHERRPV